MRALGVLGTPLKRVSAAAPLQQQQLKPAVAASPRVHAEGQAQPEPYTKIHMLMLFTHAPPGSVRSHWSR